MASVRARRSFIVSTDSGSDRNYDSAVVIKGTSVKMAQALNRDTDEESSATHSGDQDTLVETSVYKNSYTLEH